MEYEGESNIPYFLCPRNNPEEPGKESAKSGHPRNN